MKKKENNDFLNNPSIISNFIIFLIVLILLLSQSFAVNNNLSASNIFRDIINHNINYILVLIYFVFLKTKVGKKYFNYLNVFLVILYLIFTVTSCLSVFQAVSLSSILSLAIKIILLVYLSHSMFRDTRYWKDFFINSPLNELDNDWYFYCEVALSVLLLAVQLILVSTIDGAVLAFLDCLYVILLSRYVYLYRLYLENKGDK